MAVLTTTWTWTSLMVVCRCIVIIIITSTCQCQCQALRIEPLPKVHVDQLSLDDFDSMYLNQNKPIIIRGSTACPADLTLSTIARHCQGSVGIPGNYVHTMFTTTTNNKEAQQNTTSTTTHSHSHSHWAGLKAGPSDDLVQLDAFVQSMGRSSEDELRFMFDIPIMELCPRLSRAVRLPPPLLNIFASHFQYRHLQYEQQQHNINNNNNGEDAGTNSSKGICTRLPFFNMYLAEAGFATDLHIDSLHTAFVASMCQGRKRWRVMTPHDFSTVYDQIGVDGLLVNTMIRVMSSIVSPIDTWSPSDDGTSSSLLASLNVTIYEGVLEPGETLYIPPGAPHAATTLDQSLMVASNDRTMKSFREALGFCDMLLMQGEEEEETKRSFASTCRDFQRLYPLLERNQALYSHMVDRRKETTLANATGCESTFDLLPSMVDDDEGEQPQLAKTVVFEASNIRQELQKGPWIVMKRQNTAGWCLYLLKHWEYWTQGFDPPVRVAVINCLHENSCPHDGHHDDSSWLQQLTSILQERGTPSFLYVQAPTKDKAEASSLHISSYHGMLSLDDLRVWISVVTGSKIIAHDISPGWWKLVLWLFHWIVIHTTFLVETIGPALVGLLFAVLLSTVCLGLLFVWDSLLEFAWCQIQRSFTASSTNKKDN
jgi:hypothetical protein